MAQGGQPNPDAIVVAPSGAGASSFKQMVVNVWGKFKSVAGALIGNDRQLIDFLKTKKYQLSFSDWRDLMIKSGYRASALVEKYEKQDSGYPNVQRLALNARQLGQHTQVAVIYLLRAIYNFETQYEANKTITDALRFYLSNIFQHLMTYLYFYEKKQMNKAAFLHAVSLIENISPANTSSQPVVIQNGVFFPTIVELDTFWHSQLTSVLRILMQNAGNLVHDLNFMKQFPIAIPPGEAPRRTHPLPILETYVKAFMAANAALVIPTGPSQNFTGIVPGVRRNVNGRPGGAAAAAASGAANVRNVVPAAVPVAGDANVRNVVPAAVPVAGAVADGAAADAVAAAIAPLQQAIPAPVQNQAIQLAIQAAAAPPAANAGAVAAASAANAGAVAAGAAANAGAGGAAAAAAPAAILAEIQGRLNHIGPDQLGPVVADIAIQAANAVGEAAAGQVNGMGEALDPAVAAEAAAAKVVEQAMQVPAPVGAAAAGSAGAGAGARQGKVARGKVGRGKGPNAAAPLAGLSEKRPRDDEEEGAAAAAANGAAAAAPVVANNLSRQAQRLRGPNAPLAGQQDKAGAVVFPEEAAAAAVAAAQQQQQQQGNPGGAAAAAAGNAKAAKGGMGANKEGGRRRMHKKKTHKRRMVQKKRKTMRRSAQRKH